MEIIRRKSILTSKRKDVTIKINTIFRFKSLVNYKHEYIRLYNYNRIVTKERIINIYVEKDD